MRRRWVRHHQTVYTPHVPGGSWWVVCTCGHSVRVTEDEIRWSGQTAGEYVETIRRSHP